MSNYKWYVVQAYSGSEKSVLNTIKQRAEKADLLKNIEEILVPTKKLIQVKKGKKVEVEKNFYPGYVLINMSLSDELWHLIKQIPKVSGFISQNGKPLPISKVEVDSIIGQLEDDNFNADGDIEFEIGETIKVIDGGAFDSFTGVIDSVDTDKKQLSVSVTIFGRSTPLILEYNQVEKI
jgi:transcriptional antiterminator NusG